MHQTMPAINGDDSVCSLTETILHKLERIQSRLDWTLEVLRGPIDRPAGPPGGLCAPPCDTVAKEAEATLLTDLQRANILALEIDDQAGDLHLLVGLPSVCCPGTTTVALSEEIPGNRPPWYETPAGAMAEAMTRTPAEAAAVASGQMPRPTRRVFYGEFVPGNEANGHGRNGSHKKRPKASARMVAKPKPKPKSKIKPKAQKAKLRRAS